MTLYKLWLTCAAGLFSLVLPPSARADAWNHKTKLTFNEPIELPGKVLSGGHLHFQTHGFAK